MKKGQYYRGVEDPISGTFNLAEDIIGQSERILFLTKFALYFVWFSIILYLLLVLTFLSQGNLFMAVILVSLIVTGYVTARLLKRLRNFLKETMFRYSSIKAMRDGPPAYSIPKGKNATSRFISYLKKNNEMFSRLVERRPELLRKDAHAVGRSSKRYHFDAMLNRKPSLTFRLFKFGYPGYSLYVKKYDRSPRSKDIKEIVGELEDITANGYAYPHRVCMIYKAGSSYNGLDEKAYDKLVSGRIRLKNHKDRRLNLQVAVEMRSGHYEFVPFIPELPKILP